MSTSDFKQTDRIHNTLILGHYFYFEVLVIEQNLCAVLP